MTCIAAVVEDNGTIWMGGDTLITSGQEISHIDTKVFKKGEFIMGFTGQVRDTQGVRFTFVPPALPNPGDEYEYMASDFSYALRNFLAHIHPTAQESITGLIGFRGRIYKIICDRVAFTTYRMETHFYAVGSGARAARGSLQTDHQPGCDISPEEKVLRALRAAAALSTGVGPPYTVECLGAN